MTFLVLVIGLGVGLVVGLMGVGGGIVLVPALVYLLGFGQHLAQGTSVFLLLGPTGLGALQSYWKKGHVDLHAGLICAGGFFVGGYFGSLAALRIPPRDLEMIFGVFLMGSAMLLLRHREAQPAQPGAQGAAVQEEITTKHARARWIGIFAVACGVGVMGGLLGVGGGILLVPLLILLFRFDQHRAQGTSLVTLVLPTGLLAFLNYNHVGDVSWRVGLLLIPGVFLGGILGGRLAQRLSPALLRNVFSAFLLTLGGSQVFLAWRR